MALPLPAMDPCYLCEIVTGNSNGWNVIGQDDLTVTILRRPVSDWGSGPPHLATLDARHRAEHLDYAAVTEEKLRTVELLRQHFAGV